MASPSYGYKSGPREIRTYPVKSGETWANGDILVLSSGYLAKAAAGGKPFGVAFGAVETAPSSDGLLSAQVDVGETALYYYAVGTGTITLAMQGTACDLAGDDTLDVTASADDGFYIVQADVTNNAAWVRLRASAVAAGVV